MKSSKKIPLIVVPIAGFIILLYLVPTNEFFGSNYYNSESPAPMMILENNHDEILKGFKITPVSCSKTTEGLNESHFQIANNHSKDYDVILGISFTENDSILYEKEISVRVLGGQTTDQIHLSDKEYDNPVCVVQINDWLEI